MGKKFLFNPFKLDQSVLFGDHDVVTAIQGETRVANGYKNIVPTYSQNSAKKLSKYGA